MLADSTWTFVQIALALLALLAATLWLRRRVESQALGPGGRSVRLTAEHAVHVVHIEGRRWMIGTGPAGSPTLLAELPSPLGSPVPESAGSSTRGATGGLRG